jgi:manganese/zinc/iron transport system permease protein
MNPYNGQDFLGFFATLFLRLWLMITGQFSIHHLATDETQLLVLMGVAASSAIVGTFLVLRRTTMLANSISHTILLGIVLVFFFTRTQLVADQLKMPLMLFASVLMGFLTAFLTEFLTRVSKLQEDASTGLVFTCLFALGIIAATLVTRSTHIGAEVVMGNVDALHAEDCLFVLIILLLNVSLLFFFLKEYQITTFDPLFAKMLGISTVFFNYLLMAQVSATIVGAFRAVGVLMVLAFITGPVMTAKLLTKRLGAMIWVAIGLGCLASLLGVALSRHLLSMHGVAISTGGLVVCMIVAIFVSVAGWHLLSNKRVID